MRIDLTGMKFGRLTAVSMQYGGKNAKVSCLCECGSHLVALAYNLRNGNTRSCGCLSREVRVERGRVLGPLMGARNVKHGMAGTPTYVSWQDAKKRCFSPQNKRYAYYGGRGITMCADWAGSFSAFLRDMGERQAGMTLDRIDVNGNYEPGNCRWASHTEQMRNTTRTKLTADIVREARKLKQAGKTCQAIADRFGVGLSTMQMAISGNTWAEV